MLVVAALVSFLSIAGLITGQFSRFAGRQQGDNDMVAAGDAGLEYLYAQFKAVNNFQQGKAVVSSNFPASTTLQTDLNTLANTTFNNEITYSNPSISLAGNDGVASSSSTATGTNTSTVPGYPGWSGKTYNYVATVKVNTGSKRHYGFFQDGTPGMVFSRYFQVTQVPLFQAAIFYENKLEIHPGANMTVTGLVHTNNNLWARGFEQLQFMNNVSYVGTFNQIGDATVTKGWDGMGDGIIPGVTTYDGFNNVPMPVYSDGKPSSSSSTYASQVSQVSPIDPFGGTQNSDNYLHNLITIPSAGSSLSQSTQVAYNNAALIITVNSSLPSSNPLSVTVTDGSGNTLSAVDTAAVKAAINTDSNVTNSIYDQRESSTVTLTNLDMTKLALATVAPTTGSTAATALQQNFANKGLVYIYDVSPTTNTQKGIRLVNGSSLGQNITVATNGGLYIQGDYNTGGVPPSDTNTSFTASPVVTGYNRYASAVMADAVTILSDSWEDSNSNAALSARTATPTTVNTAILSGDIPSNYNGNLTASGGAHNFPRFLENWSNINFTYYGSLVEAFRSTTFTGLWQTNNVYSWPNRNWNFDMNFQNQQPPGIPNGVLYTRGRWQRTNG